MHNPSEVTLRPAGPSDCAALAGIYNRYVLETIVTFDEEPKPSSHFEELLTKLATLGLPCLVAQGEDSILGYALASPWKDRSAYRQSVEVTIYLDPEARGRGTGRLLYTELLTQLSGLGLRTAIGGISLPNAASVALHEALGFEKVAHFKEVGFKLGRYIDVGYWQRRL